VNKTKTTSASSDFFLHAYELCEVTACFLWTEFIAPFFNSPGHKPDSPDAGNRAGYPKHQADIPLNSCANGFFYLLIGNFSFFPGIIQLAFGCKSTFCKADSFQLITTQ